MIKRSGARCCDSSMIARCNPCPCPKIMTWRTTRSDKRPSVNEVSTSSSLKAGRRVASAKARLPASSLSPFGKIGEIGKIGQIRKYTGNTG